VTVTRGDLIDVSASIQNVGDISDTQTVEFRIDDETVAERRLELDGRESRRITFEEIDTRTLEPDEYEHGVFTEDDSETGTLTVEAAEESGFMVTPSIRKNKPSPKGSSSASPQRSKTSAKWLTRRRSNSVSTAN